MTGGAKLKVACVEAGYFSQFHYDSWARMDRVALVGACDHDLAKAMATGVPGYDDLNAMISEQTPDVLDVIVPPDKHAQTIHAALAAGIKWIICQKPFCNDLDEAKQITQAALAVGATIVMRENFWFQPWYRAIKSALDRGDIGEVQQTTFRQDKGQRPILRGSPIFNKWKSSWFMKQQFIG